MGQNTDLAGFKPGDQKVEAFHRSRIMFAIIDDALEIADEGVSDSHTQWFVARKWIKSDQEQKFEQIIRGYILDGNIYFYTGRTFETSEETEATFLKYLPELLSQKMVADSYVVNAGKIPQTAPGDWPPRKVLGTVKELLTK